VAFELGRQELAFWGLEMKNQAEPGTLFVWVTANSAAGTPAKVEITP
jgi:hypothetical protein